MGTHVLIDEDVLRAAERLAREQHRPVGEIISELARRSLPARDLIAAGNGLPTLPISCPQAVVTIEHVNRLRDEGP
jgi:hypothetical protein